MPTRRFEIEDAIQQSMHCGRYSILNEITVAATQPTIEQNARWQRSSPPFINDDLRSSRKSTL